MYYVYLHTLPNGKIYVGQTRNLRDRWLQGEGYKTNYEFYKDIMAYGWDNIKHEVLCSCDTRDEAEQYERQFIIFFGSENKEVGYSQTSFVRSLENKIEGRYEYDDKRVTKRNPKPKSEEYHPFKLYDIPISAAKKIINEWIYNEVHREVAIDKFCNGLTYEDLANKYGVCVQRAKGIVGDCRKIILDHI